MLVHSLQMSHVSPYAECHYAECHFAECYYAEGRGAFNKIFKNLSFFPFLNRKKHFLKMKGCFQEEIFIDSCRVGMADSHAPKADGQFVHLRIGHHVKMVLNSTTFSITIRDAILSLSDTEHNDTRQNDIIFQHHYAGVSFLLNVIILLLSHPPTLALLLFCSLSLSLCLSLALSLSCSLALWFSCSLTLLLSCSLALLLSCSLAPWLSGSLALCLCHSVTLALTLSQSLTFFCICLEYMPY
jgi:hypothetical protein